MKKLTLKREAEIQGNCDNNETKDLLNEIDRLRTKLHIAELIIEDLITVTIPTLQKTSIKSTP